MSLGLAEASARHPEAADRFAGLLRLGRRAIRLRKDDVDRVLRPIDR